MYEHKFIDVSVAITMIGSGKKNYLHWKKKLANGNRTRACRLAQLVRH